MNRKSLVLASVFLALAACIIILAITGFYPVLIVNGSFITARDFSISKIAAQSYVANLKQAYGSALTVTNADSNGLEISVFDSMIETSLIHEEAAKEMGSDLSALLQNKIGTYEKDAKFTVRSAELYGVPFEEFKTIVLVPRAEKEILAGRFFLNNQNVDDWLASAKKHASVIVLSPRYRWNGSEVELR